ncbi:hypothetical protein KQX54_018159 [Cotesia glomerata]|uniref:Uncharacterized protein n=1 Tax=Cotesia glomerata TaxID=32391 RepID=A0AAV7HYP3_COTGL|nr:hypothetical protein KQX54_018159 [Cotesia glomerata]
MIAKFLTMYREIETADKCLSILPSNALDSIYKSHFTTHSTYDFFFHEEYHVPYRRNSKCVSKGAERKLDANSI